MEDNSRYVIVLDPIIRVWGRSQLGLDAHGPGRVGRLIAWRTAMVKDIFGLCLSACTYDIMVHQPQETIHTEGASGTAKFTIDAMRLCLKGQAFHPCGLYCSHFSACGWLTHARMQLCREVWG